MWVDPTLIIADQVLRTYVCMCLYSHVFSSLFAYTPNDVAAGTHGNPASPFETVVQSGSTT